MNPGNHHRVGGPGFPIGQHDGHFHGFLEAAPDAVVIIDARGAIAQVNSQTEKLFGYRREELIGAPLEVLMPARYRSAHVTRTRAYSANPYPRPMGVGLDLFGLRKDGSEFPIDVCVSPLPSDSSLFIASTIRDMTSHRRLEAELRQQARELEEADRQKDNYLSAVAHELRTPLTTLTLAAQILRLSQANSEIQEKLLDRLERQAAHMARLIEDLLDMTRVRCGTLSLHREVVDLREVIADALEIAQPLVDDRKHNLDIAPCSEPVWVSGDPTRLVQVVSNLLTNAARYTPEGGHIWCSAARGDGTATIRIRDDGIGIQKEMLSSIFELFTRAASAGDDSVRGLGIGLTLVRRLVELHGGTVEATSEGPSKGSELIVRLPLLSVDMGAKPA